MHVIVVGEDLSIFYDDVYYAGIFEVLAETAYCDAISAVAGYLLFDQQGKIRGSDEGRDTFWTKMLYDLGLIAMQSSPPWYTILVNMMMLTSMVSKPSVFCTQFEPNGALTAVALLRISSNHIFVPFMMFKDHKGGSLT